MFLLFSLAVCEKCGAIGVKHAFYTRERRFCSMACARGYSGLMGGPMPQMPDGQPMESRFAEHRFKMEMEEDYTGMIAMQPFPQLPLPPPMPPVEDSPMLSQRRVPEVANSFDWEPYLNDENFVAAPVSLFKHAPIADVWSNILVGMKVSSVNHKNMKICILYPDKPPIRLQIENKMLYSMYSYVVL